MKTRIIIILALLMPAFAKADPPESGKNIFMSRCASCHNVNKQLVGPALAGVDQRRSLDWIVKFVNSSQTLIKSGDTTALALYQKFNNMPMPDHSDLGADEIKQIVEYIKSEAKPASTDQAPFAKPGRKPENYKPLSLQKDYGIFFGFLIVVGLLIASLLFAVRVNEYKNKLRKVDE